MIKCPDCKRYLDISCYYRSPSTGARASYCRECSSIRFKSPRTRAVAAIRRDKWFAFLAEIKSGPCTDCGVKYPAYVMEFDHVGVKTAEISDLTRRHQKDKLLAEIKNCELVCANCHKERTYGPRSASRPCPYCRRSRSGKCRKHNGSIPATIQ